ncbi:hypothetical protein N7471_008708 [Penicillium samsonianum]|uniref:uncharacterized protein n=1 Tax=Penicillium samsonianum TaxID=1882272 RepID=UPI00254694E5|nr:uncharacterized protein N7471_008708 [Penicillium samsonianum]KAJ6133493.1 hypothetical protein N7471_008708 [Penicillium samsonianum]
MLDNSFNFNFSTITLHTYCNPGTKASKYKVADTRPIPSPNNEQLEKLTVLTTRAKNRAKERREIDQKMEHIMRNKEARMAAYQRYYQPHPLLEWDMNRELERLNQELERLNQELEDLNRRLDKLQAKEEEDAISAGDLEPDRLSMPTMGARSLEF